MEGAAIDAGIGRVVGGSLDVDEIAPTACPMVVADMATVFSRGETNADVIPCSESWLLCDESRSAARLIPTTGIIEADSLTVTETGSCGAMTICYRYGVSSSRLGEGRFEVRRV